MNARHWGDTLLAVRVVRLDDLEEIPVGTSGLRWKPLRLALGIEAFGVNAYTAAPGQEVVEHHDELKPSGAGHHEELYVVVSGRAVFDVDGEELDAPAGTCVFLEDPAQRRGATAAEEGTVVLAIGGTRGEPFRVSPWEYSFRASAAPTPAEAVEIVEEGLERYPENASLLYNLACFESLAGSADAALVHLERAVDLEPSLRERAWHDPDFDALRDHAGFPRGEDR